MGHNLVFPLCFRLKKGVRSSASDVALLLVYPEDSLVLSHVSFRTRLVGGLNSWANQVQLLWTPLVSFFFW